MCTYLCFTFTHVHTGTYFIHTKDTFQSQVMKVKCNVLIIKSAFLSQIMKSEIMRINHEQQAMKEKIKVNCTLSCYDLP